MRLIIIFFLLILYPTEAFAYFDPGTGSLLIQVVVGAVAGIAVFFGKIKAFFSNYIRRQKDKAEQDDD